MEIIKFTEVESTQDLAFSFAENNCNPFTFILADYQTKGRGQIGRVWHGEIGNSLLFSVVIYPSSHSNASLIPIRTGIALTSVLQKYCSEEIKLKWPNDLFVNHGKLCGILCEAKTRKNSIHLALGVGLNLMKFDFTTQINNQINPAFLQDYSNEIIDKNSIFTEVANELVIKLSNNSEILSSKEIEEFNSINYLYQKVISKDYLGKKLQGIGIGINEFGHFKVVQNDGEIICLISNL